jgi:phosphoribosylformylglycinamidine cyclo-ligase
MPGVYPEGEIELVGFGVGVVERDRVIDGSGISQGDAVLGLGSSGFHSLVREIVDAAVGRGAIDLRGEHPELNTSPAAALLAPTRIYAKAVLNVMRDFTIKGMAHITGGGFVGNVPRVLPKGVCARIDPTSWRRPPIFDVLQHHGEIGDAEMLRVFNCGIGMVLIVPSEEASDILDRLQALGERAYRIGEIEVKAPDAPALRFEPGSAPG